MVDTCTYMITLTTPYLAGTSLFRRTPRNGKRRLVVISGEFCMLMRICVSKISAIATQKPILQNAFCKDMEVLDFRDTWHK